MAVSGGVSHMLTQCPICLEDYKIPRALPCLHTFCESCLVDYIKLRTCSGGIRVSGFGSFVCPVCKEDVTLPPQGIKGFKHNFYIASFAGAELPPAAVSPNKDATENAAISLEEEITCQRCEEKGVSKICLKCAHWLCPFCCEDHVRVRATRDHILVSLSELMDAAVPDSIQTADLSECTKTAHASSAHKFFCVSCKMLICEHCHAESHGSHTHHVLSVIPNVDKIRQNLLDCLSKVQERRLVYKSQHHDLTRYRKDINKRYHSAQKTIFKTVDMLQKRMLDFKTHIYRELKKSINSQSNCVDNYISETSEKIAMLDSLQDGIKSLLEMSSNRKIITQADDYIDRGNLYLSDEKHFGKLTVKYPKVDSVDKMRIDILLYELIGTVSIISKDVDIGPERDHTAGARHPSTSSTTHSSNSSDSSPPADTNISLPLILTQPCSDDQLPSPTEASTSEICQLSAGAHVDPLSEGEEAHASRLPLPSPTRREHQRVQDGESESQSTTCDDDSDSSPEDKSSSGANPPIGPFYSGTDSKTENPDQESFWVPKGKSSKERSKGDSPGSQWKAPYPRLHPPSPSRTRQASPSRSKDKPPSSPPARLMARRIKPFIRKWKARQNQSSND